MATYELFSQKLKTINIGLPSFGEDLITQEVETVLVDWQIPAGGNTELINALKVIENAEVEKANHLTIEKILKGEPVLIGMERAQDVIPGMGPRSIFHAGPPLTWERMCPGVQRGVLGAIVFEGWAKDRESALELIKNNEIEFSPNHFHNAVGPMTGIISPSMPVWVVENRAFGNRAYSTLNEGKGVTLWYGDFDESTIERLTWFKDVFGPNVKKALDKQSGTINVFNLVAQGLSMGDEVHVRCQATTALVIKELVPLLAEAGVEGKDIADMVRFMARNNTFSLNLAMAASKSVLDAAHGVPNSTIVTAMTRNGTDFGIRVGGMGDQWFITDAPALDDCLYYAGFSVEDAVADIGDSAIIETVGFGGMTFACAPTIASFVGGGVKDAIELNKQMASIAHGRNKTFAIPNMDFAGSPTGIDIRKVVESRIVPIIDTGVIHKEAGIGQIGAGVARAPISIFEEAVLAMAKTMSTKQ
ncbi:MAG TPA: DUF1116 domain-containing protein [Desulfitobacterium dehalogenans]|uniref:DUF1116 domain-containing protein n=1 Tax=Desulfitobacterium dehalogenans TaxID=36854 RepID=A0A7C6Z5B1_9FIRM|nr:DUF1116 domain-containing protein [Desulfitobacterium dehalogenans]